MMRREWQKANGKNIEKHFECVGRELAENDNYNHEHRLTVDPVAGGVSLIGMACGFTDESVHARSNLGSHAGFGFNVGSLLSPHLEMKI